MHSTVAVVALTAIVGGCYALVAIARIIFGRNHAVRDSPPVAQLEERVARLMEMARTGRME